MSITEQNFPLPINNKDFVKQERPADSTSQPSEWESRQVAVNRRERLPIILEDHCLQKSSPDSRLISALKEHQEKLQEARNRRIVRPLRQRSGSNARKLAEQIEVHSQLINFFQAHSSESIQRFFEQNQEISQHWIWGKRGALSQKSVCIAIWQHEMRVVKEHMEEFDTDAAALRIYQGMIPIIEMVRRRLDLLKQEEHDRIASRRALMRAMNWKSRQTIELLSGKMRALLVLTEKIETAAQRDLDEERLVAVNIAEMTKNDDAYQVLLEGGTSSLTTMTILQLAAWEEGTVISRKRRVANEQLNELINQKNLSNDLEKTVHQQVNRAWRREEQSYKCLYKQWLIGIVREKPELGIPITEQHVKNYLASQVKDKAGDHRLFNGFLAMGRERVKHYPGLQAEFQQTMETAFQERQERELNPFFTFGELEIIYTDYTYQQIRNFLDLYDDFQKAVEIIHQDVENAWDNLFVREAICLMHNKWAEIKHDLKALEIIREVSSCRGDRPFQTLLNRYQEKVRNLNKRESCDYHLKNLEIIWELDAKQNGRETLSDQEAEELKHRVKDLQAFINPQRAGHTGESAAVLIFKEELSYRPILAKFFERYFGR